MMLKIAGINFSSQIVVANRLAASTDHSGIHVP